MRKNIVNTKWRNDEIINILQKIGKNNIISNKILVEYNKKNIICHPSLIRNNFGSLENACKIANVKYINKRIKSKWCRENIIKAIITISKKYKNLSKKELNKLSKKNIICHVTHIRNRFPQENIKILFKKYNINLNINTYDEQFGKEYAKAKIEKTKNKLTYYTKDIIINQLLEIYKYDKNVTPKKLDFYSKNKKIACNNIIRKHFKTYNNLFKEAKIKYKSFYWTDNQIIKSLKKINKLHGPLFKVELNKFRKKDLICGSKLICNRFKSLNNAAKIAGFKFILPQEKNHKYNGKVGKNETKILDEIENEKNIKLKRQYRVDINEDTWYFIDGYDMINNIAYEVDEQYLHQYTKEQDKIKDEQLNKVLNCKVIRVVI